MVSFLINQGWSPEGAELMSWAMHPFDTGAPPSTRSLQKKVKRTAEAVGQRGQRLEEPEATTLAANALASYCRSALDDGNQPLARFWGDLLPAAPPTPSSAEASPPPDPPRPPTPAAPPVAVASPPAAPAPPADGWLHAVTLPPGRLAQLGSLDQPLEAVGRVAAQVLTAHLVGLGLGPDQAPRGERAALAGYLIDLDLAGVAVADIAGPTPVDLDLASVMAALEVLDTTDLAALAHHHSPAAEGVLARLLATDGSDGTTAVDPELVAGCLGAGLCLARVQRTGA